MYNSIQHFVEFGTERIEEKIKNFIKEGKDIADLIFDLQEDLLSLGRDIVTEVLEDADDYLRDSKIRKQRWETVRKDPTSILTSFGNIEYQRTYFKPKKGGKRCYLVDKMVGIEPHDRISADVEINALEEASESSYRKGGEKAAFVDEVTKQTVMGKIHKLEIQQPPVEVKDKKEVKVLFIEADEDHVANQNKKRKNKDKAKEKSEKGVFMPKLIYVHEGFDNDRSSRKRAVLKNPRYFGGLQQGEDLWLDVAKYIDKVYDMDKVETIYISGDGASWIKQGLNWIPKSKYVLDNYHLNKYVKMATAHMDDEAYKQSLKDALDEADKEMLNGVFDMILKKTEAKTKQRAVKDAKRYMLRNWAGIKVKVDNLELVGCSAEGHVSHILSKRLSSRPMGWSRRGVDNMAQLLVYRKNGGKVYDLVMAQKRRKAKAEKEKIQDDLVREMKYASKRYENVWNSNIAVTEKGKKTGLYHELKSLIG